MIQPEKLNVGDTIALISPAKAIDLACVAYAKSFFESAGYRVVIGPNALGVHTYFSGTDSERASDLQWALDHPEVKAIVCNRGGYGAIRLIDHVNWANWLREPKWLIGFSDITNFHLLGLKHGIESIHATMPLNFLENSPEALSTMLQLLVQDSVQHNWASTSWSKPGEAKGKLIGGNMSILYSLLGTPLCPDFEGAILFLEDLGEQMYHMDRMIQAFKLAGVFEQIAGLVIGGMTEMKDTENPTLWTIDSLFKEVLAYRSIPVCFDAPIGHISDNRAVIVGRETQLIVGETRHSLTQSVRN